MGPGEAEPRNQKGTRFWGEDPTGQRPEGVQGERPRHSPSACCGHRATHFNLQSPSQRSFPAAREKAGPHLADQEPGPQRSRWSQQGTWGSDEGLRAFGGPFPDHAAWAPRCAGARAGGGGEDSQAFIETADIASLRQLSRGRGWTRTPQHPSLRTSTRPSVSRGLSSRCWFRFSLFQGPHVNVFIVTGSQFPL